MKYNLTLNTAKGRLFIIILLVHFCFFVVKISLGDYFLIDSYEYYSLAENIKDYFEFYSADINSNIQLENYTKRPPLYSIFILLFSFLLKSKISVLIIQNILAILSIHLCLKIFEYYYKQINYKILTIFLITSLSQFIYANYLMSEILFQFLIVSLCYVFHKIITKKKTKYILYFQLIIVLLFLTKPVFYLFVIPNIMLGVWLTKHHKYAYLFALIPIIICALYMNWNYQRTGSYDFSSIQNTNLKNYNLYYFHLNKYGEEYAQGVTSEILERANKKNTYAGQQKEIRDLSLAYLKKDLFSYAFLHLEGSAKMFLDPGRFDLYNFFEFKNNNDVGFLEHLNKDGIKGAFTYFKSQPLIIIVIIPIILLFNLFKIIGFALFWIKQYKNVPSVFWFMLFIISYFVALTGIIGATRFLVVVLPIYLLIASLGFLKMNSLVKQT